MEMCLPLQKAPHATERNILAVYVGTHATEGTCSPIAVLQTNSLQNAVSSQSGGLPSYSVHRIGLRCSRLYEKEIVRRNGREGRDRRLASSQRKGLSVPTFFQIASHYTNQAPGGRSYFRLLQTTLTDLVLQFREPARRVVITGYLLRQPRESSAGTCEGGRPSIPSKMASPRGKCTYAHVFWKPANL
jgi:hypothetical protein